MDHGLPRYKQRAEWKQGFLPSEMYVYDYNNPNVYKTNHNGRPILSNNIIVRIIARIIVLFIYFIYLLFEIIVRIIIRIMGTELKNAETNQRKSQAQRIREPEGPQLHNMSQERSIWPYRIF